MREVHWSLVAAECDGFEYHAAYSSAASSSLSALARILRFDGRGIDRGAISYEEVKNSIHRFNTMKSRWWRCSFDSAGSTVSSSSIMLSNLSAVAMLRQQSSGTLSASRYSIRFASSHTLGLAGVS